MMDLTFLIPTRIETEDRLRNIISSVSYLLRHVPAKVIVKEVSGRNTFLHRALPEIRKYADTDNLTHIYEENNDPLFCKSKVLNDLIVASDTSIVANYDADCILPKESYRKAYEMILHQEADVVYPYGCGIYQWKADFGMDERAKTHPGIAVEALIKHIFFVLATNIVHNFVILKTIRQNLGNFGGGENNQH